MLFQIAQAYREIASTEEHRLATTVLEVKEEEVCFYIA
jgi:hypothetical protein